MYTNEKGTFIIRVDIPRDAPQRCTQKWKKDTEDDVERSDIFYGMDLDPTLIP